MTEWLHSYSESVNHMEYSLASAADRAAASSAMELEEGVFAAWRSHTLFYTVASSMFYLFIVRYREVIDAEDGISVNEYSTLSNCSSCLF
jgi:hypothetical protein